MPATVHRPGRAFLDSNVLLYLLSSDTAKADITEGLLRLAPVISVQVLNEVTNVCLRKLRMGWDDIDGFMEPLKTLCEVVPLTVETHERAREIAQRYQLSWYDACIAAAADLAGCETMYSEDIYHGLVLGEGPVIRNPFSAA